MIDFHTHILPGVDDGSESVDVSLRMLEKQWEQGICKVVLTPHFYPGRDKPETFLQRRQEAFERLKQALTGRTDIPELILAAEVGFYPGMSHSDLLKKMTIADTPYILVEMPETAWTSSTYRELENLYRLQGLIPVIAHVERYLHPLWPCRVIKQLEQLPVLVQANGTFFTEFRTRALAMRLLKRDVIDLLGSDCHGIAYRPPCLKQACDRIARTLGKEMVDRLVQNGQEIFAENTAMLCK